MGRGAMIKNLSIALLLLLSACGFQPIHGKNSATSPASPLRAGIEVVAKDGESNSPSAISGSAAPDKIARQFRENLEDLVTPVSQKKSSEYKLDVTISQNVTAVGISKDGTASRYNLQLVSDYTLTRLSDDKKIDSGRISTITSYNNPSNQYFSSYMSEKDARKRGAMELAQLYRQRLSVITENSEPPTQQQSPSEISNPLLDTKSKDSVNNPAIGYSNYN